MTAFKHKAILTCATLAWRATSNGLVASVGASVLGRMLPGAWERSTPPGSEYAGAGTLCLMTCPAFHTLLPCYTDYWATDNNAGYGFF